MVARKLTASSFQAILASSVHDMKNSLSMLLNTFDEIASDYHPQDGNKNQRISNLQYQASRVNNDLMKLLSLYKIENDQYPLNIAKHAVADFLEEQFLRFSAIASGKGITLDVVCDEDLWWYFDASLLAGVVNDAVGNATHYCNKAIRLSAKTHDGYLLVSIEDDGEGFPEFMLDAGASAKKGIDFTSGSTGLGLYFCSIVAKMHSHEGRYGYVELDNAGELKGGRFLIYLP